MTVRAREHWTGARDIAVDAWQGVSRRRLRSALTALGTVAGIAALVAILGLTATIQVQISSRFDVVSATEITVKVPPELRTLTERQIVERIRRLNGVESAGGYTTVAAGAGTTVVSRIAGDALNSVTARIVAASAEGLATRRPRLVVGRLPSTWHYTGGGAVALVGEAVAAELGVDLAPGRSTISVGDRVLTVIGIIADSDHRADLSLSLVLAPRLVATLGLSGPDGGREFVVRTRAGATQQVAREIPLAVFPDEPTRIVAEAPPDPRQLRRRVAADTRALLLVLATVCLVIGAVGIANATLVSVMERRAEIGVRRALGATRARVVCQFLLESVFLGTAGGLVGTASGLGVVAVVALVQRWTVAVPPGLIFAPLLGGLVGLLAGAYPALRAARVDPVHVLRG